jgi:hypothetical protein
MKNKQTAVRQLLNCIPNATEIMDYISENQADEKMLDNWLWERIYKDREWIKMEKEQIINTFKDAQLFKVMNYETRAEQYYNETYG